MLEALKHRIINANGTSLHVVDQGNGPLVLFCHGFPATWRSWKDAMGAVAHAGYRAAAFDMRGYGDSDAPDDANDYTPFHTVGDVIAILDSFGVQQAVLVGHDFGASTAWNAAMMRPDRISAVFGVTVPFLQPGGPSFLETLRSADKTNFYMFDQMKPETDRKWANAAETIPSNYYWTSGEPPESERWDPFDPVRNLLRRVSEWPMTIDPAYFHEVIPVFQRTGFHGPLNYYRCIDTFWKIVRRAYSGYAVQQPSFFLTGQRDGLNSVTKPTEVGLRASLPGLRGFVEMENVGHWPQLEEPVGFNAILVDFLLSLPAA
ncbi:alpha/beta hydrolase [Rhizobium sp. BE258]|uniref:alpha/beta fold hydrolase n=1 Tax=Rhizobium sp. BE258 TaxID=2817722 RepID=UPI002862AAF6|nr:alpha/beta hydrolase [Rhizobium sp. BE258]MDR7144741.1 pimeloyl-ACP methyl ester carboxylesterase [Rhizobium sp. BE258]